MSFLNVSCVDSLKYLLGEEGLSLKWPPYLRDKGTEEVRHLHYFATLAYPYGSLVAFDLKANKIRAQATKA